MQNCQQKSITFVSGNAHHDKNENRKADKQKDKRREKEEKVFRSASNFSIVLNAIAQISHKSERSQGRLKTKVTFECFEVYVPFISRSQAWE